MKTFCLGLGVVLGIGAIVNGLCMLWSPTGWYFAVPGVTTTSPFNQHFLRDTGLIYLFLGGAFLFGAARPHYRVVAWAARHCGSGRMRCSISGKSRSASAGRPHWRADYAVLQSQFNAVEIANLTVLIGTINLWNRVQIGLHAVHPLDAPTAIAA